jgi:hypothetical protein
MTDMNWTAQLSIPVLRRSELRTLSEADLVDRFFELKAAFDDASNEMSRRYLDSIAIGAEDPQDG